MDKAVYSPRERPAVAVKLFSSKALACNSPAQHAMEVTNMAGWAISVRDRVAASALERTSASDWPSWEERTESACVIVAAAEGDEDTQDWAIPGAWAPCPGERTIPPRAHRGVV